MAILLCCNKFNPCYCVCYEILIMGTCKRQLYYVSSITISLVNVYEICFQGEKIALGCLLGLVFFLVNSCGNRFASRIKELSSLPPQVITRSLTHSLSLSQMPKTRSDK
ncbi:hypothetical protein AMTRI_Chr10g229870 [Amborella trichopoda]